jgi:hypothetical protein
MTEKRNHALKVWLTSTEKKQLYEKSKLLHLTPSQFIRRAITEDVVIVDDNLKKFLKHLKMG